MESKFVTAGYSPEQRAGERPTVFRNDKLSQQARAIMTPVWEADYKMKLNLVNRLNILLYDRAEPVIFNLNGKLNIMYRYSLHRVVGVVCKKATRIMGQTGKARRLYVILRRNGSRLEVDALSIMNLSDIMKMYEMVARRLYPRDDNPDGIGAYDDEYYFGE